jgi:hypothetical protein
VEGETGGAFVIRQCSWPFRGDDKLQIENGKWKIIFLCYNPHQEFTFVVRDDLI